MDAVFNLLNVEQGKSETTKEQVLIVKKSGVKFVLGVVAVLIFLAVGFAINKNFEIAIERRATANEHYKGDLEAAKLQKKVVKLSQDLESHLVSEIKERDDTMRERDAVIEKVDATINANDALLTELFDRLNKDLEAELDPVPGKVLDDFKADKAGWESESSRIKKVNNVMEGIRKDLVTHIKDAKASFLGAMKPLKETMSATLQKITSTETARGEHAANSLETLKKEMQQQALNAAEANSHVEEHLDVAESTYSEVEKKAMLSNYFRELELKVARSTAQLDEIASGAYADIPLGERVIGQLQKLAQTHSTGKISDATLKAKLQVMISKKVIPEPADSDLTLDRYLLLLLHSHPPSAKELGVPELDCTRVETCHLFTAPCFVEKSHNCFPLDARGFCPKPGRRCTSFPRSHGGATVESVKTELTDLRVLQGEQARWAAHEITDSQQYLTVLDHIKQKRVPAIWLFRQDTHEQKEERPSANQKKWIKDTMNAIESGVLSREEARGQVMERYNEGKLTFDAMTRLGQSLASVEGQPVEGPQGKGSRASEKKPKSNKSKKAG